MEKTKALTVATIRCALNKHWKFTTGVKGGAPAIFDNVVIFPDTFDFTNIDLRKVEFQNCQLHGINFSLSSLEFTKFVNCNLTECDFSKALLVDASFEKSSLVDANFEIAIINDTNFAGANLEGAHFTGSHICECNFSNTSLFGTNFINSTVCDCRFNGAHIDWQCHEQIANLLMNHAGEDIEKIKVAAMIRVQSHWCWPEFKQYARTEKQELREWVYESLLQYSHDEDHKKLLFSNIMS